jgi:hypothetical protein
MTQSRRAFLGIAGTGVVAGTAVALAGSTPANASPTTGIFNVMDYGATGNGTTDDTAAIQAAINAAAAYGAGGSTGAVVILPAGKYVIGWSPGLIMKPGVSLEGVGWNGPTPANPPTAASVARFGTWILAKAAPSTAALPVIDISDPAARGCSIRRIAFDHVDQTPFPVNSGAGAPPTPWTPNLNYGATIYIVAENVLIEDVMMARPTYGINIYGGNRTVIHRLFGQPFSYGLQVDNNTDVIHVSDVHFWPFSDNWVAVNTPRDWTFHHGRAIQLLRCDNAMFQSVFAIGYEVGFYLLGGASGPPSQIHISNSDIDSALYGIYLKVAYASLLLSNVGLHGIASQNFSLFSAPYGDALLRIEGDSSVVHASNLWISYSYINAIRITGTSCRLASENLWVQYWNTQNTTSFASVDVAAGSSVYMGLNSKFDALAGTLAPAAPNTHVNPHTAWLTTTS